MKKSDISVAGLARALFIYGLLLGGAVIFTIPFIWMIGTSFKVDREMFGEKITLMPMKPLPAQASPYLDVRYFPKPQGEDAIRVMPVIEAALRERALPLPDYTLQRTNAVAVLAPGIYKKLRDTLQADTWKLPDEDLFREVRARITDDAVEEVARKIYRHFSLGTVRVRSFELQEKDVTEGIHLSQFWKIDSGAAVQVMDEADTKSPQGTLVYEFPDAQRGSEPVKTITLNRTMDLPFRADHLFRVQISLQPDDSWHRLDFYVEKNGKLYRGVRPEFLGDFQPAVVSLQEYGPDDRSDSNKIRLWIAYKEVASGPQYESGEYRIKVSVVMSRSSQAQAWWAKCHRNYRGAMNYIPFGRYIGTSAFLVILNIVGNIFSCSLVAFAFSRLQWPGRNFCFGLMMATMMIPPQVTMIPYFLIIKHLGWYNTLQPLWFVSFFGNAFNIFLLRQFMKGIPRDLEDAAKIDGCNFLQVYWNVIMPLIKPTLACIAIFTFMGVWNDFMGPLIYLSDQRLYPLSLGLYALNVQEGGNFGMMMAGSLLMTLPVIAIFFFAQKYFIQGVTLTGMKG